jgi:hypothetical protein
MRTCEWGRELLDRDSHPGERGQALASDHSLVGGQQPLKAWEQNELPMENPIEAVWLVGWWW